MADLIRTDEKVNNDEARVLRATSTLIYAGLSFWLVLFAVISPFFRSSPGRTRLACADPPWRERRRECF